MPTSRSKSEEETWQRLVQAAKTEDSLAEPENTRPQNLTSRISNLREQVRSLTMTLTWRRWSLLAAVLGLIIYLIAAWSLRETPPRVPPNQTVPDSQLDP